MNTSLLTKEEFLSTFAEPMTNVIETTEPALDIWPYVQELVENGAIDEEIFEQGVVESVYRNGTNTYDQLLLPTKDKNTFVVIIVDLLNIQIKGHYILDLNKEYGRG